MSDTLESLRKKMVGEQKLQGVVRTMKTLAATNMRQFESARLNLMQYHQVVDLGLLVFFQDFQMDLKPQNSKKEKIEISILFGSDQGLVGQFNENLCLYFKEQSKKMLKQQRVFVVGERTALSLSHLGLDYEKQFQAPSSLSLLAGFFTQLLQELDVSLMNTEELSLTFFYNKPELSSLYSPCQKMVFPFALDWQSQYKEKKWPNNCLPQKMEKNEILFEKLIEEYLFGVFFSTILDSMVSENASRFVAMQRAEKNIEEQLVELQQIHHRLRQNAIDTELFDVISGFEALQKTP